MTASRVVDITWLRRLQEFLSLVHDTTLVLAGFMLCASFVYLPFLLLSALTAASSARARRGGLLAPLIVMAVALTGAGYLLHQRATLPARLAAGGYDRREREVMLAASQLDFFVAMCLLGLFVAYLCSLAGALVLRRALPAPRTPGNLVGRWRHRVGRLRSSRVRRAAVWYAGCGLLSLLAMGPFLADLAPLALRIRPLPPRFQPGVGPLWVSLCWMAWTVTFAVFALRAGTRAKRLAAASLAEARSFDTRPPVLLLRSFGDDFTPLSRNTDARAPMRSLVHSQYFTLEEAAEDVFAAFGPVIAIGRPGETLPPAGAAREYVSNEAWRTRVQAHIAEARLIVLILGRGEGLEFEYRALAEQQALPKAIVAFPPVGREALGDRWARFAAAALSGRALEAAPPDWTLAAVFDREGPCFVTCRSKGDEDTYRLALKRSAALVQAGAPVG